jgi:hypothetical protein
MDAEEQIVSLPAFGRQALDSRRDRLDFRLKDLLPLPVIAPARRVSARSFLEHRSRWRLFLTLII